MPRYLFIDGGALRAAVGEFSETITGDKNALTIDLATLADDYHRIFYYDAISAQQHGETTLAHEARIEAETAKFEKIQALPFFHVVLGRLTGRPQRQKRVDVGLAVDMLTHTFRKNMDAATLFARDDDFTPLVQALVREGMIVQVWHPPMAAKGLLNAADIQIPFTMKRAIRMLKRGDEFAFSEINHVGNLAMPTPDARSRSNNKGINYFVAQQGDAFQVYRPSGGSHEMVAYRAPGATENEVLKVIETTRSWSLL